MKRIAKDRALLVATVLMVLFVAVGLGLVVYWALLIGPVEPTPDCLPQGSIFWLTN